MLDWARRMSGEPASDDNPSEACSGALIYHVLIWLVLDLQARLFRHRDYVRDVVA